MGANEIGGTGAGATRRDLLKKAAAAGAVVWTTPQVLASAAWATEDEGRPWWCANYPNHPLCKGATTTSTSTSTTTATTQPTTTTTTPPPGGKTICGSVRFTTYKVIKWHFVGSGSIQRVGANSFKATKAYKAACLAGVKVTCGATHKTVQNMISSDQGEAGVGADNANQNHGFTETAYSGTGPYTWKITPPSGWTLVAGGGELWGRKHNGEYKDGSDCSVVVSPYADFPNNDGSSETNNQTTYAIVGNEFVGTGYPHWVELVIAQ